MAEVVVLLDGFGVLQTQKSCYEIGDNVRLNFVKWDR